MKVFIFGNKGNMGRRYTAILKFLGHEVAGIDGCDGVKAITSELIGSHDAFIVATPTATHLRFLRELRECGKKVLCEKPIVIKDEIDELAAFLEHAAASDMQLTMVSQYDQLLRYATYDPRLPTYGKQIQEQGETSYDYFKTGSDGMAWDCINIIYHAHGKVSLRNHSPMWKCVINGHRLDNALVDESYIEMIEEWLESPYTPQYDRILTAHLKVMDYLKCKI